MAVRNGANTGRLATYGQLHSITYVIKPLFTTGSVSVLVGEGGTGKTYALMDAAVCTALGEPWLQFETTKSPSLIIDEESGQRRLSRRLRDTLHGHFADDKAKVGFVSLAHLNLYETDDVNMLHLLVKQHNAGLVVIDALADIMPGGDENSSKDIQPIFIALRTIAEDTQSAIVLIHHSNKAGTYRGSTAIKAACDLMLMLESSRDNRMTFTSAKTRDIEPITFGATSHFEPGQYCLTSSEPRKQEKAIVKSDKHVLLHLSEHGDSSRADICASADICSSNAARQAIYRLNDRNLVCRANTGKIAIYTLTKEGKDALEKLSQ